MAATLRTEDVINLLKATKDFLTIILPSETLSPSTDMERKDIADKLQEMVNNLSKINLNLQSTTPTKSSSQPLNRKENVPAEESGIEDYEILSGNISQEPLSTPLQQSSVLSYEELKQKVSEYQHFPISKLKEGSLVSGYLLKHKNRRFTITWHKRYCILKEDFIFYFKSDADFKELGVIILPGYSLALSSKEKDHIFVLETKEKGRDSYTFQADSRDDFEKWRKSIAFVTNKQYSKDQLKAVQEVASDNVDKDDDTSSGSSKVDDICFGQENKGCNVEDIYDDCIPNDKSPNPPLATVQQDFYDVLDDTVKNGEVDAFKRQSETIEKQFSMSKVWIGLFDCQAESSQDLSFKQGDIVYIYAEIDMNWSMGYSKGKTGLVPNNHLTQAFK